MPWRSRSASRSGAVGTLMLAVGLTLAAPGVRAEAVTVAVASNFSGPMQRIAAAFEADSGHEVALAFGSSGKFFAQISNGAPFQALFSADQATPRALEAGGLAVAGSRFTYAIGALVLWSPRAGVVDAEGLILKQGRFERLALANPRLAPYGRAALEVLQALNLEATTRTRWVQGENVGQAYQFVASGNADVGLIALAQVMAGGRLVRGSAWRVPAHLYGPIRQDAVVLAAGRDSAAVLALMAYMRGDAARTMLRAHGYRTVAG